MMSLRLRTDAIRFQVSLPAVEKVDPEKNAQKVDRDSNVPLWTIEVVALEVSGASVIRIVVPSKEKPAHSVGSEVVPQDLEAIYWSQGSKSGLAYRAQALKPVAAVKAGS